MLAELNRLMGLGAGWTVAEVGATPFCGVIALLVAVIGSSVLLEAVLSPGAAVSGASGLAGSKDGSNSLIGLGQSVEIGWN